MYIKKSVTVLIMVLFLGLGSAVAADNGEVADAMIGSGGIQFSPKVAYSKFSLSVSSPNGDVINRAFEGSSPYFDLSFFDGLTLPDGLYTYELQAIPSFSRKDRKGNRDGNLMQPTKTQTGYFTVKWGTIVTGAAIETPSRPMDISHLDDVIIDGSLCVGTDCASGESFGFDTIRLKENNLRIKFQDTSSSSFPTNDWEITINDSTSGGASYFAVTDVDAGKKVFTLEAGAPSNSLYVDDNGRLGIGTSTPAVQLHNKDGDTPTLRLDQDTSSGWIAQIWDLAGNESNFFIRDVTHASYLPFRIQPGTPTNTLTLRADGTVGIGTWSPDADLEIQDTGSSARFLLNRTDGATGEMNAKSTSISFGSNSDHPVQMVANDTNVMYIDNDGDVGIGSTFNTTNEPTYPLQMSGGAYCTGTNWVSTSTREAKENIRPLDAGEAIETLEGLQPVRFNYKKEKDEEYLGFIAEDVPELVSMKSRKGLVAMDVVAVLTQVVQEQQKTLKEQKETMNTYLQTIEKLEKRIEKIEEK